MVLLTMLGFGVVFGNVCGLPVLCSWCMLCWYGVDKGPNVTCLDGIDCTLGDGWVEGSNGIVGAPPPLVMQHPLGLGQLWDVWLMAQVQSVLVGWLVVAGVLMVIALTGAGSSRFGFGVMLVRTVVSWCKAATWLLVRGGNGEPAGLARACRMSVMPAKMRSLNEASSMVTLVGKHVTVLQTQLLRVSHIQMV